MIVYVSLDTAGSRPPSNVLQEAKIEVMKHVNCRKIYGSKMINPGHICVLEKSRFTKGACNVRKCLHVSVHLCAS